jgi:hypothetical protein
MPSAAAAMAAAAEAAADEAAEEEGEEPGAPPATAAPPGGLAALAICTADGASGVLQPCAQRGSQSDERAQCSRPVPLRLAQGARHSTSTGGARPPHVRHESTPPTLELRCALRSLPCLRGSPASCAPVSNRSRTQRAHTHTEAGGGSSPPANPTHPARAKGQQRRPSPSRIPLPPLWAARCSAQPRVSPPRGARLASRMHRPRELEPGPRRSSEGRGTHRRAPPRRTRQTWKLHTSLPQRAAASRGRGRRGLNSDDFVWELRRGTTLQWRRIGEAQ